MNFKFGKRDGITQMQTILIVGIVGLFLFAFVFVPFYKSCKQKSIVAKLKVVHSAILQANKVYSMATSEPIGEFDIDDGMSAKDFAKKYFTPYLPGAKVCEDSQAKCWNKVQYVDLAKRKYIDKIDYSIIVNSSIVLGFYKDKNGLISIIADVNGKAGENKLGNDVFIFSFYDNLKNTKICDNSVYSNKFIKEGLHFGGYDKCGIPFDTYSYEELSEKNLADGCNKKAPRITDGTGVGSACMALIYASNWAMDKKYPW